MANADKNELAAIRFVSLDTETTGLNPRKDRIISLGAVAIQHGEIVVEDGFDAVIPVDFNSSAVIYHGITREESQRAKPEHETLAELFEYIGSSPVVGHHIGHDAACLYFACQRSNITWSYPLFLDTDLLTRHIAANNSELKSQLNRYSLEELCLLFDIAMHDRHTAPGDAFLTAQVFLRLMRYCNRISIRDLNSLQAVCKVSAETSLAGEQD